MMRISNAKPESVIVINSFFESKKKFWDLCLKNMEWLLILLGEPTHSPAAPETKAAQFMKGCRLSKSCMTVQTTAGNNKQDGEQDGEYLAVWEEPLIFHFWEDSAYN